MSGVFEHLDEVVERLADVRDELLADELASDRAARLAEVFELEALAWSQLYELATLRLVWRAALAAEAGARANAARWAGSAAREKPTEPQQMESHVARSADVHPSIALVSVGGG
ncbi:hypothetical protein [Pseudonocardia charpentierae]|uniref:DUF222 domain-containing protein n=1 Tax=Pseudonocardia charpentierae TaxID=3075545 RepID=A0ABU2NIR3_9PSEU|nr:hypothetical protein [Pseudonocardia sp. DSM 45834]MDT0352913.1 hypothetical protein [Pseudonocardia sp. DSM 45834]